MKLKIEILPFEFADECGTKLSKDSPNIKTSKMKKEKIMWLAYILIIGIMLAAFTSCATQRNGMKRKPAITTASKFNLDAQRERSCVGRR